MHFSIPSVFSLSLLFGPIASLGDAHEFWIAPQAYLVSKDAKIIAELRNGQGFSGVNLPYLSMKTERLDITYATQTAEITMRNGDTPALVTASLGQGLHLLAYQSSLSVVSYEKWENFASFVVHKDLGVTKEAHLAAGFALENFSEIYRRFSKSLVGVGSGQGFDRALGLEVEFVAQTNPFATEPNRGFEVLLLKDGAPSPHLQIEIFEKAPDETVNTTTTNTNAEGRALFEVKAGHSYMLDAVFLRHPTAELAQKWGADYESRWANLTFYIPPAP